MPRKGSSAKPPEAMTWSRGGPVVAAAVLFDVMRAFFDMFWFFGPALAAIYCTSKVSGWVGSLWGLTAAVCTAGAAAAGVAVSEITAPLGVVMAMAVGIIGFLVLGLWILATNSRLFKVNAMGSFWFVGGFGLAEIPFVGALPLFSLTLWRLYKTQIRIETEALKKWEAAHQQEAAEELRERQRQAAQLIQARNAEAEQAQEQEALEEEEAAREEEEEEITQEAADNYYADEIPDEMREAA